MTSTFLDFSLSIYSLTTKVNSFAAPASFLLRAIPLNTEANSCSNTLGYLSRHTASRPIAEKIVFNFSFYQYTIDAYNDLAVLGSLRHVSYCDVCRASHGTRSRACVSSNADELGFRHGHHAACTSKRSLWLHRVRDSTQLHSKQTRSAIDHVL
jgi:hypothetical protein